MSTTNGKRAAQDQKAERRHTAGAPAIAAEHKKAQFELDVAIVEDLDFQRHEFPPNSRVHVVRSRARCDRPASPCRAGSPAVPCARATHRVPEGVEKLPYEVQSFSIGKFEPNRQRSAPKMPTVSRTTSAICAGSLRCRNVPSPESLVDDVRAGAQAAPCPRAIPRVLRGERSSSMPACCRTKVTFGHASARSAASAICGAKT